MAWEQPQSPWGQGPRPPSLEKLIANLLNQIREAFAGRGAGGGGDGSGGSRPRPAAGPGGPSRLGRVATFLLVLFLLNAALSSFYTVQPGERGVVLRLGRYAHTTSSGLNFKIPYLDEVVKVDVEKVQKEEFGFRTKVPGQQTTYEKGGFEPESLMLTGDKNVIDAEWIVQYKIRDPMSYLFRIRDPRQTVRDVSETVIRRVMGNANFDYVLSNREILAAATAREMQESLDRFESGIDIVTVQLQDVNPPERVKPAFNEVNEADQDMKRLVNEAEEAYNREIPKARGTATQLQEEARGYAIERVNNAQGETARFLSILEEYRQAPEVTRKRMYLETMRAVLPNVKEIYVMDAEQGGVVPFLDLSRGRKQP
ncbi:MAG: FtsH protease activity modulator HflK [Thermodesulfobacteriota bacterium]